MSKFPIFIHRPGGSLLFLIAAGIAGLAPCRGDGDTIVDVDATSIADPDGSVINTIANGGTAGIFTTVTGTVVAESRPTNNNPAVMVKGLGFNGGDKMTAAMLASEVGMSGNQAHTVCAWVYNPGISAEEAIVAWGHRGGPDGSNMEFHSGTNDSFGAVGHWGGPDVGYANANGIEIEDTAGRWAFLAYVYDPADGAGRSRVFIDGGFNNANSHGALNAHSGDPLSIGSANDNGNPNSAPTSFSGTIARVRVFDTAMTDGDILAMFQADEPAFFGAFPDPSLLVDGGFPPPAINLGSAEGGGGILGQTINIENPSSSSNALSITDVRITGPDASAFSNVVFPGSVAPGEMAAITFDLDTSVLGALSATLEIDSNDGTSSTISIALKFTVAGPGGIVAFWCFDTDATDLAGAHDGVLRNNARISSGGQGFGGFGEALELNLGQDVDGFGADYMSAGNPGGFDFNRSFTWHACYKTENATITRGGLLSRSPIASNWNRGSKALFLRDDGGADVQWDTGWIGNPQTNVTNTGNGAWHCVIVTYDSGNDNLKIFVDPVSGSPAAQFDGNQNVNAFDEHTLNHNGGIAETDFRIGLVSPNFDPRGFRGWFDEVAVFNRALTGADLDKLIDDGPQGFLSKGPPVANDDTATMHHDGKVLLDVLSNDSGGIKASTLRVISGPADGTATSMPGGRILYAHTSGTPVSDTFTYEVEDFDGTAADTAVVTIEFTDNFRFETDYTRLPPAPPVTVTGIENAFPTLSFDQPHGCDTVPGDTRKLFVTEADGRIHLIEDVTAANPVKTLLIDITAEVMNDGNERAMKGIAVHPDWANNGYIFVTYNTEEAGDNNGRVRLTRFTCTTSPPYGIDPASRLVLIDMDADDTIHSICSCHFGADGYLYVGAGDEGTQSDGHDNSQHIDRNLWSCLIRIDVDKKPGSLHPNPDPAPGSDPGGTNNDGDLVIPRVGGGTGGEAHYAIPPDNPLVGVSSFNGVALNADEVRTEIIIVGQRNPWQFWPDDTDGNGTVDEIWVGDVGRGNREEVSVYTFGGGLVGNGAWGWREGTSGGIRNGQLLNGAPQSSATLTEPLWDYPHGGGAFAGNSVTAGLVYRGSALPDLVGKFVFADYVSGNVWALERTGSPPERLGGEAGIVALEVDPSNDDILLVDRSSGLIQRLTTGANDSGFPATLSDTGFFADLSDLSPQPGAVSYTPNLRFWSDFGEKTRWCLVKNTTDTIGYSADDEWTFPGGMIWVKHFDMATEWESFNRIIDGNTVADRRPTATSPRRRLETRYIVKTATAAYGVSYRWENINAGIQADATLAADAGEDFMVDITIDATPAAVPWRIPSRSECMACHTPAAGHALSFNTRQLNAPGVVAGIPGNFLTILDAAGYLAGFTGDPAELPRHVRPDETQYSLEARVRSYLDVNCAHCHRNGGTGGGNWDGRAHLTLPQTGIVNGVPVDAPVNPGDLLVIPRDVNGSIIYNRAAAANGYTRMPPLATTEIDLEAADLLADWIASEIALHTTYQEWRIAHFGNDTSPEGEPAANPDGDQGDNNFEWLTNTAPKDASSFWRPTIRHDATGVSLDFAGIGNRRVTAFHSFDLIDWFRWPVAGNNGIPLDPAAMHTLHGPAAGPGEFFQFQIDEN